MTETHAAFLIHVERKTAFLLLKKWLQTTQACGPLDQSSSPGDWRAPVGVEGQAAAGPVLLMNCDGQWKRSSSDWLAAKCDCFTTERRTVFLKPTNLSSSENPSSHCQTGLLMVFTHRSLVSDWEITCFFWHYKDVCHRSSLKVSPKYLQRHLVVGYSK